MVKPPLSLLTNASFSFNRYRKVGIFLCNSQTTFVTHICIHAFIYNVAIRYLSYIFIQFTNSPCIIGDTLYLFQILVCSYTTHFTVIAFLSFPPAWINANICSSREMNALYHTPLRIAKDYLPFSKKIIFFFFSDIILKIFSSITNSNWNNVGSKNETLHKKENRVKDHKKVKKSFRLTAKRVKKYKKGKITDKMCDFTIFG